MKNQWLYKILSALMIATLAVAALPVTPARAATLVVTTSTDAVAVDGLCTLREAIVNANNDAATNVDCLAGTGSDTITFDIAIASPTITLGSSLPAITDGDGLIIDGTNLNAAGGEVTLSGAGAFRISSITLGATTFRDITFLDGQVDGNGGAISNTGGSSLTIDNVKFTTNRTVTSGGNDGGAIYHISGDLSISNSTFTSNYTEDNGGAIYLGPGTGTVAISGSAFDTNNNAVINSGGAIYMNNGTMTVNDTTFTGNTSSGNGGAIFVFGGTLTVGNTSGVTFTSNSADNGGAIYHNSATLLTVANSTFTGNTATGVTNGDGGAIKLDADGSSATISGSTFTSNVASDAGGAIFNDGELFMVTMSVFTSNSGGAGNAGGADGGAINITSSSTSATSKISLSSFINNSITMTADQTLHGGAISNDGTIIIANVTFSGNSVTRPTPGSTNVRGGAVYADGATAITTIHNSTFSGNTVSESGSGTAEGGSIYSAVGGMTIANSIVANGTENGAAGNCGGTFTNGGNNVDFNGGDCGFAITTNPNLGALTGSPQYFPLNSGSSAIDTGSNAICLTPATTNNDAQNGLAIRPINGDAVPGAVCDIGSYEALDTTTTLTLLKVVVNDNGGTAVDTNWTLAAAGPTPISGIEGNAAVTNAVITPGTYTLSESGGPTGYTQTDLSCSGAADTDLSDGLTIGFAEDVTCSFTNDDDAPSLTLEKTVVNDSGGVAIASDWTLTATGPTGFSGAGPSVSNGASFDAGIYDLSESGPAGYSASAWVCVGGTQNDNDTITLGLGESATCTITNDDTDASLTLEKVVVNDNGAVAVDTDWTLSASGPTNISGVEGDASITNAGVIAGSYTLSENGPADYTQTDLSCSGAADTDLTDGLTIAVGEDVTCTFTNDDDVIPLIVSLINSNPATPGNSIIENESILDTLGITQIMVEFNKDVYNPPLDTIADDVTNPANYKLVRSSTGTFATVDCAGGVLAPDISISVDSVTYDNGGGSGPFIATLSINGGFPLNVVGFYRLYVCGTTSIVETFDPTIALSGNGITPGTDFRRNFRIATTVTTGGGGGGTNTDERTQVTSGFLLPVIGFAPHQTTTLPAQPADKVYKPMREMTIEIPALGINFPIVGASITNKTWDLTWLQNSVAYLEGSAYPTLGGNTVLAAHVLDAANNIGPFSDIKGMQVGQTVYIHANGQTYVYQVQENKKVLPTSIAKVFKHEEDSWVTLITCEDYNAKTGRYTTRRMVRAVLISVIPDKK